MPLSEDNTDDLGDADLGIAPKTWSMNKIIDKPDFIKIKNFSSGIDYIKRIRKRAKEWEKKFTNTDLMKVYFVKYTKNY